MNGRLKEVNRQKGTRHRIDSDMTKEQMARLVKMWTEAREKSKNGVKFYVVGKENPILRSRELSEEEKGYNLLHGTFVVDYTLKVRFHIHIFATNLRTNSVLNLLC
jgi:hypothetical protein